MRIFADLSTDVLQSIRMIHAVAESRFDLILPHGEAWKFEVVRDSLGMQFQTGNWTPGDIRLSEAAGFSHDVPSSQIGRLSRPLIFPHAITKFCRSLWAPKRTHRFGFAGLMTPQRKVVISKWLSKIRDRGFLNNLWLWTKVGLAKHHTRIPIASETSLVLDASRRGREFPLKCWDVDYYKLLGTCEFILCPNGDFIWTYRFFEAVLCGAIPIVQEPCPIYEGFKFLAMSSENLSAEWSQEVAEHNYQLCIKRITLPLEALNKELELLVKS